MDPLSAVLRNRVWFPVVQDTEHQKLLKRCRGLVAAGMSQAAVHEYRSAAGCDQQEARQALGLSV
jgi:hypothetical protein